MNGTKITKRKKSRIYQYFLENPSMSLNVIAKVFKVSRKSASTIITEKIKEKPMQNASPTKHLYQLDEWVGFTVNGIEIFGQVARQMPMNESNIYTYMVKDAAGDNYHRSENFLTKVEPRNHMNP